MTRRMIILFAATTSLLWVVPSIGTQGMGTIDARVTHADAPLFDRIPARRDVARTLLSRADRSAEAALGL